MFENENPALRTKPLAVQQKQIVVTCNYEARRRGLHKLQLIKDAKRLCPDVVIVLGEDLTRFRDASKDLYLFLKSFSWNQRVERLGFDEVFMDVSDVIDYNIGLLNRNHLSNSFLCLSKDDPTSGFRFDASIVAGHTFPDTPPSDAEANAAQQHDTLRLRLALASHLAQHIRAALDAQKGYTCTVGISTNKTLAKLVGNLHKPNSQTTLLPPYGDASGLAGAADGIDNVTSFMDSHEVSKVPGIGCKIAQKLRAYVTQRRLPPADDEAGAGAAEENALLVSDVRTFPGIGAEVLERVLSGSGTHRGVGHKVWDLLNGCDNSEVGHARDIPRQISIEDTYRGLETLQEIKQQLRLLGMSLLRRMHADLLEVDDDEAKDASGLSADPDAPHGANAKRRWLAFPKTIRLSTRPRPSGHPDGRWPARISRSAPLPNFIFSLKESPESTVEKLIVEVLIPLFRRLHPEKSWSIGLLNIAATNIVDAASDKGGVGRDISKMFRQQEDVLKAWKVEDAPSTEQKVHRAEQPETELPGNTPGHGSSIPAPSPSEAHNQYNDLSIAADRPGSEDIPTPSQNQDVQGGSYGDDIWESGDEGMAYVEDDLFRCNECGAAMPLFAMAAHERWHIGG